MPFLRVTRDQRGYETTLLLHAPSPSERPRVLYWYRTAPAVRVGRPPLDEDAIRVIEEQHPDIEFDWQDLLDAAAAMAPEPDTRTDRSPHRGGGRGGDQERRRKSAGRPREQAYPSAPPALPVPVSTGVIGSASTVVADRREPIDERRSEPPAGDAGSQVVAAPPARDGDVLAELVGREIAIRLRSRYEDIITRIDQRQEAEPATRDAWQARAAALDPDSWATPEEILQGVQQADRLLDELRRDIAAGTKGLGATRGLAPW